MITRDEFRKFLSPDILNLSHASLLNIAGNVDYVVTHAVKTREIGKIDENDGYEYPSNNLNIGKKQKFHYKAKPINADKDDIEYQCGLKYDPPEKTNEPKQQTFNYSQFNDVNM